MRQHTIKKAISCSGIGLHSGKTVKLTLAPANTDTGVVFCIKNDSGTKFLELAPQAVTATSLATTLGSGADSVSTVEHLLAALAGLGVDNVRVEVEGNEMPIMDGSAASFVFLLNRAGIRAQDKDRVVHRFKKTFTFKDDDKFITAEPYDGFYVDYTIDFPHPIIGKQRMSLDLTPERFVKEIGKARTFGFMRDVEYLQKNGLALGGSLDNAIVLDEYSIVNPEGLRFPDEFVRHKILDFVGDMAMFGRPLQGKFTVNCSGHALNNSFLRELDQVANIFLEEISPEKSKYSSALQESVLGVPEINAISV